MRHRESEVQRACVRWFRRVYHQYTLNLFAVPNGGERSRTEAAIMKGEGTVAGVSDMILLLPNRKYHSLCIEFKQQRVLFDETGKEHIAKTYQSAAQKEWQGAAERAGSRYVVIRTLDEFQAEIEAYMSDIGQVSD